MLHRLGQNWLLDERIFCFLVKTTYIYHFTFGLQWIKFKMSLNTKPQTTMTETACWLVIPSEYLKILRTQKQQG